MVKISLNLFVSRIATDFQINKNTPE